MFALQFLSTPNGFGSIQLHHITVFEYINVHHVYSNFILFLHFKGWKKLKSKADLFIKKGLAHLFIVYFVRWSIWFYYFRSFLCNRIATNRLHAWWKELPVDTKLVNIALLSVKWDSIATCISLLHRTGTQYWYPLTMLRQE